MEIEKKIFNLLRRGSFAYRDGFNDGYISLTGEELKRKFEESLEYTNGFTDGLKMSPILQG